MTAVSQQVACQNCHRTYATEKQLKRHQNKAHRVESQKEMQTKFNEEESWTEATFEKLEKIEYVFCYNKNVASRSELEFYCCVCNKNIRGLTAFDFHLRQNKHQNEACGRYKRKKGIEKAVRTKSVDEVLLDNILYGCLSKENFLTPDDLETRSEICRSVEKTLKDGIAPDLFCRLCGSSLTRLGFRESDVNIDVKFDLAKVQNTDPKIEDPPSFFYEVVEVLKNNKESFSNVKDELNKKVPEITFKHVKTGLTCVISPSRSKAYLTSDLIKKYTDIDERFANLALLFRLWSKICGVDRPGYGSLPPYCLVLMVINYLQHTKPQVLPIINIPDIEFNETDVIDEEHEKIKSVSFEMCHSWKGENTQNIASLFLGLFQYYLLEFHVRTFVVNIRQHTPVLRSHKNFGNRRFAMEDPFISNQNVASSMASQSIMTYFQNCMEVTFKYFATYKGAEKEVMSMVATPTVEKKEIGNEVTDDGDDVIFVSSDEESESESEDDSEGNEEEKEKNVEVISSDETTTSEEEKEKNVKKSKTSTPEDKSKPTTDDDLSTEMENLSLQVEKSVKKKVSTTDETKEGVPNDAPKDKKAVVKDVAKNNGKQNTKVDETPHKNQTSFDQEAINKLSQTLFERQFISPCKKIPRYCVDCNADDHGLDECKLDKYKLKPLPELSKEDVQKLDKVCEGVIEDFQMTTDEYDIRMNVLKRTESLLRKCFNLESRLSLFGSSVNGFGFQQSDMDVCLRFEPENPPEGLDCVKMVVEVAKVLERNPQDFHKVNCIKWAKVPIVKFCVRHVDIEADISLYNCLALSNSAMLKTYSKIDKRVQILGYCVKVFAKVCEIGDASRGSLSSYAYILMLLYYLQHCQPPLIPVLQEIEGAKQPEHIVEGCNTWFYSDLDKLSDHWAQKNKLSVGELWLGFFTYYLEQFQFNKHVIAIRKQKPLTKFQKGWARTSIAIEDPFNMGHNLGAGITKNMFTYIINCFKQARQRYGTPVPSKLVDIRELKEYFFEPKYLTNDKNAPKDRCCRICGHIGHIAANCTKKSERNGRRRNDSLSDNSRYMLLQQSPSQQEAAKHTNERTVTCYHCNAKGHRKSECPELLEYPHYHRERRDSDRKPQNNHGYQQQQRNGVPVPRPSPLAVQRPDRRERNNSGTESRSYDDRANRNSGNFNRNDPNRHSGGIRANNQNSGNNENRNKNGNRNSGNGNRNNENRNSYSENRNSDNFSHQQGDFRNKQVNRNITKELDQIPIPKVPQPSLLGNMPPAQMQNFFNQANQPPPGFKPVNFNDFSGLLGAPGFPFQPPGPMLRHQHQGSNLDNLSFNSPSKPPSFMAANKNPAAFSNLQQNSGVKQQKSSNQSRAGNQSNQPRDAKQINQQKNSQLGGAQKKTNQSKKGGGKANKNKQVILTNQQPLSPVAPKQNNQSNNGKGNNKSFNFDQFVGAAKGVNPDLPPNPTAVSVKSASVNKAKSQTSNGPSGKQTSYRRPRNKSGDA